MPRMPVSHSRPVIGGRPFRERGIHAFNLINGVPPNDLQRSVAGGGLHAAGPNIAEEAFQGQGFGDALAAGHL
jgi:hypothetical protein